MAEASGTTALPGAWKVLRRDWFDRPPAELAPELLGKLLVRRVPDGGLAAVRLVEVEAYGGADDAASHGHRRATPRNAAMFGPPGHLYVYFTYGMHHCANVVAGPDGVAGAVLLRAGEPYDGVAAMWGRRPAARAERDLCSGPAKLCAALAIDRELDGTDLVDRAGPVLVADDGTPPPSRPERSTRIGISAATQRRWRWTVPGSPWVSRRPRVGRSGTAA